MRHSITSARKGNRVPNSTIAQAAYGSYDYQIIFNANRNTVAANPNALDPGTVLVLPCEDGRLTAASAVAISHREGS